MDDLQKQFVHIIEKTELFEYVKAVKKAAIPGAWIVGGAIRNTVWKELFGNDCQLEVKDIDVPYFSEELPIEKNQYFAEQLEKIYPTGKWECDNQAWVHLYEPRTDYYMPHAPYNSLEESMEDFWFSVNTIGIRLNKKDEIEILHPEALPDLFDGVLRVLLVQNHNPYRWLDERIEKITSRCSKIRVVR